MPTTERVTIVVCVDVDGWGPAFDHIMDGSLAKYKPFVTVEASSGPIEHESEDLR